MDNRSTQAGGTPPDDRRSKARMRALKAGKIVFNNAYSVIDCTVRNLSETGCCLQVGDPIAVPEKFDLHIGPTRRQCHVVWRKDNRVGVQFA
ncbi:MAG TPA: PilZ domain-containing protein [Xanthobacteraceae bacterium]|jgi:hypothetical protein